jgi:CspA family cold shock protein
MVTGTVEWINADEGYGCIRADDGREEIFAQTSANNLSNFKFLKKGQKVDFEITQDSIGKQASNIQVV